MKFHPTRFALALTFLFALPPGSAGAQTTLTEGGDINETADWDNGLPGTGNEGTIQVTTGTMGITIFGFGVNSVVNLSSGTITADDGFNMNGGGTWNITGGKLITRYFLSNGSNATINMSGGEIELKAASTNFISTGNGGIINISGSAVLNAATNADQNIDNPNGDINFAPNWTGQWSVGSYAADAWKTLFTTNPSMKFNGANIDAATFDATFTVSDGGQTLSLVPPGPVTDFQGGDMLVAENWSNGLPLNPPAGTVAVDGSFNDSTGIADWLLSMSTGTITVGQDWHFTGASNVSMAGGTLDVTGNILSGDESILSFNNGEVNWAGNFEPSGTPGGTIVVGGGTFTGTANAATRFGNVAGGTVSVSGGLISASTFNFAAGASTTVSGGAILSGDSATFGVFNILRSWSGSYTLSNYSDTDWENQFTAGNITLAGETLDAEGFIENFVVSDAGQTLTFSSVTNLISGDINFAENWSNGSPSATTEATIAVDGSNSITVFGFGGGAVINQTAGTITAADGFNFNRGDTWNLSGGSLIARYILANEAGTMINITGGTVVLPDVGGAQQLGAVNGGAWNVSGSAEIDGTHATTDVQTGGPVNIASDWTGKWVWGFYTGSEWEDLFVAGLITLDNEVLDLDGFRANFSVSEDGTTLSRFGGAPKITKIVWNANGTVTLTWDSRPGTGANYTLLLSSDLSKDISLWADENDSIPTDGVSTTYTTGASFNNPRMFFVVVQN